MKFDDPGTAAPRTRPYGPWPWFAGASVIFLTAAIYFAGRAADTSREIARLRGELRVATIQLERDSKAFAIIGASNGGQARAWHSQGAGALLLATGLSAPPAGKTYAMWLTARDGSVAPAGTFEPDASGTAVAVQPAPIDDARYSGLAVTVEDASVGPRPSRVPFLVLPFGDRQ